MDAEVKTAPGLEGKSQGGSNERRRHRVPPLAPTTAPILLLRILSQAGQSATHKRNGDEE